MIPVYIIPSPQYGNRKGNNNRCKLIEFFESCKIFKVIEVCKLKNSIGLSNNAIEVNLIYNALHDSHRDFPHLPCITILDTSTTISTPSKFLSLLSEVVRFPSIPCSSSSERTSSFCNSLSEGSCFCSESCNCSERTSSCSCRESSSKGKEESSECNQSYKENEESKKYKENKEHKEIYKCWDVAYLADWLDRCDLFKPISNNNKRDNKSNCHCENKEEKKENGKKENEVKESGDGEFVQTFSPHGLQALLWSVKGRKIVLGKRCMKNGQYFPTITPSFSSQLTFNIQNKNLRAITLSPPFFYFDITDCKITSSDILKTHQCKMPDPPAQPVTILPYLIFISIVVLVLLLAWFFYQIWGKYH